MNGFEKHGIEHLSASTINNIINNPARVIAEKLFGVNFPMPAAVDRGTAVEAAVEDVLLGKKKLAQAVDDAVVKFDRATGKKLNDTTVDKERGQIGTMAEIALDALRPYGRLLPPPPVSADNPRGQHAIKLFLKSSTGLWRLPVIGYLDFVFEAPPGRENPVVVDLKTTNRLPGVGMPLDHQRQRAVYAKAKQNYDIEFTYISAHGAKVLADGDVSEHLVTMKNAALRFEKFLALGDKKLLAAVVPVDPLHRDFASLEGREALKNYFHF